jgi:hypothetical protein
MNPMHMLLALARSYQSNAAKARLHGDVAAAEHWASVAQHYWRAYHAERQKLILEATT